MLLVLGQILLRARGVGAIGTYRAAVDIGDHEAMVGMFTADGPGGNSTFGFFQGRDAYLQFLEDCWLEIIPKYSMWHVIQGGRVVNRWCELLPGTPPAGGRYDHFGTNELIYAGDGQFRLQYSLPDLFPLTVLHGRWKADGQAETYGDIYPSLSPERSPITSSRQRFAFVPLVGWLSQHQEEVIKHLRGENRVLPEQLGG